MFSLETLSLVLDLTILAVALLTVIQTGRFGGMVGHTFRIIAVGLIALGIVHMLETMLFFFGISTEVNEVLHRILVLTGFLFIGYGFRTMTFSK